MTARPCPYCGADPDGDLDAAIAALQRCNNCRADIRMSGQWTGDGWRVLRRMIEIHGLDTVKAADARNHASAVERADASAAGRRVTIGDGTTAHILASARRTLCGRAGEFRPPLFDDPPCRSCARREAAGVRQ